MQERRKRIPRFEEALPTHMQAEMSGNIQNEIIHIFASALVRFYASMGYFATLLREDSRRQGIATVCSGTAIYSARYWGVSNAIRSRESWLHDSPKGDRGATDQNGCYLYKAFRPTATFQALKRSTGLTEIRLRCGGCFGVRSVRGIQAQREGARNGEMQRTIDSD